jgi:murein L,D-transpeptidase YcbB/YkuD
MAEGEALDPANYEVNVISSLFAERDPASLAMLDALLTFNLIKYIHDVNSGQIKQLYGEPSPLPLAEHIKFNPRATMKKVLGVPDLAAYLQSLPPAHRHYLGLKKALSMYRDIEKKGGWPLIPEGPTIEPGDEDVRLPDIIRRLGVTGDLSPTMARLPLTKHYGRLLKSSIVKFQTRHGLEPDGTIGPNTITALNVPVADRIRQIIINMTRWRWHSHDLGEKYVLVNIAHFDLTAFEADRVVFSMPVIVGEKQKQTPVFSDRIATVVINPFWNIPKSIARDEELPELKKDPDYLVNRHVRIFSGWGDDVAEIDSTAVDWSTISPDMMDGYRLRQEPGPWNALGQIKFVFPNRYSIYLHDTPSQNLFSRTKRDFSHGCIRVSDPVQLAAFALSRQKGEDWPPETIIRSIEEQERIGIGMSEPLPIHITYQTAWFDKHGIVCFNYDVYGRDKKLLRALFEE